MTLWSGRFGAAPDKALWALSESFSFDHVLFPYDLAGSRAHVRGLLAAGLVSDEDAATLLAALDEVESEFRRGEFLRGANDEDVHTAIERRISELAPGVGERLHTGRSRNDQVATATRLYVRDALDALVGDVLDLVDSLVALADRYPEAYLPGYTHLQRAQPVLVSHHLFAHCFALLRDVERAADARARTNVSPLGAGALAGSSFDLRSELVAVDLGFAEVFANSMDAVSDRDFVAETLFVAALLGVHLSRLGEEVVLWTSAEFAFATMSDDFATGSSMLPQKKNSDVAELARAKCGRLVGNLTGLLVTLKGLPLAYNRDLQEDKEPLFDSLSQVALVVSALRGTFDALSLHPDTMASAADDSALVAIDVAEALVNEGVAFREAHRRVGQLVARALEMGVGLDEAVAADEAWRRFTPLFAPGASLVTRRSPGSGGVAARDEQRRRLDAARERARLGSRA